MVARLFVLFLTVLFLVESSPLPTPKITSQNSTSNPESPTGDSDIQNATDHYTPPNRLSFSKDNSSILLTSTIRQKGSKNKSQTSPVAVQNTTEETDESPLLPMHRNQSEKPFDIPSNNSSNASDPNLHNAGNKQQNETKQQSDNLSEYKSKKTYDFNQNPDTNSLQFDNKDQKQPSWGSENNKNRSDVSQGKSAQRNTTLKELIDTREEKANTYKQKTNIPVHIPSLGSPDIEQEGSKISQSVQLPLKDIITVIKKTNKTLLNESTAKLRTLENGKEYSNKSQDNHEKNQYAERQNVVDYKKTEKIQLDSTNINSQGSINKEHRGVYKDPNTAPSPEPNSDLKDGTYIDGINERKPFGLKPGDSVENGVYASIHVGKTSGTQEGGSEGQTISTHEGKKEKVENLTPGSTYGNKSDSAKRNPYYNDVVNIIDEFTSEKETNRSDWTKKTNDKKKAYRLVDHRKEGETVIRDLYPLDDQYTSSLVKNNPHGYPQQESKMTQADSPDTAYAPVYGQPITSLNDGSTSFTEHKQMPPYTRPSKGHILHDDDQYWADRFNKIYQVFTGTNIFINLFGSKSPGFVNSVRNIKGSAAEDCASENQMRDSKGTAPYSVNNVINVLGGNGMGEYKTQHKPTLLDALLGGESLDESRAYRDGDISAGSTKSSHDIKHYSSTKNSDNGQHPFLVESKSLNTNIPSESQLYGIPNHSEKSLPSYGHQNEYEQKQIVNNRYLKKLKTMSHLYDDHLTETSKAAPTDLNSKGLKTNQIINSTDVGHIVFY